MTSFFSRLLGACFFACAILVEASAGANACVVSLVKVTQDGGTGLSSFPSAAFSLQLTPQGGSTITKTASLTSFTTSQPQNIEANPGTSYNFSEGALPAGPNGTQWRQVSLVCKHGSQVLPIPFTVEDGWDVTCTAVNKLTPAAPGAVQLVKTTEDGGTGLASFPSAAFALQLTPSGGSTITKTAAMTSFATSQPQTVSGLASGKSYSFSEGALPAGPNGAQWRQVSLVCKDGSTTLPIPFTLQPNHTVTCKATNKLTPAAPGAVQLVKTTEDGGTGLASFPSSAFALQLTPSGGSTITKTAAMTSFATSQAQTVSGLASGKSYSFSEGALPAGPNGAQWRQVSLVCKDGSTTLPIPFTLQPTHTVTCTAVNKLMPAQQGQQGTLKVVKIANGGDDNFNFTAAGNGSSSAFTLRNNGSWSSSLPAGAYAISEVNLPTGWTLQGASCTSGGALTGNSIAATVTGGATTTCTFTNSNTDSKKKDTSAGDVTELFIHRRVDNLLSNGPDRARIIRRLDEVPAAVSLKDGGSYAGPSNGGYPGGLKDPLRSDLLGQQGRTDNGLSGIGGQTFSASLSQMQAYAAAQERQKIASGAGSDVAPYGYNVAVLQPRLDVWVEGHISNYTDTLGGIDREGDFSILYVGGDYVVRPGLLVGALVQLDRTIENVNNPDLWGGISGTGWMAGPYVGAKLTDTLYFDARAAWGQSTNNIWLNDSTTGSRTGNFDTDRWLATAALTGNYQFGAFRVSPVVELDYGGETANSYSTSLGQVVDRASATIGRVMFGPEFGYPTLLDNGVLVEPQFSIKGIWSFDDGPLWLSTGAVRPDEWRAEVEGGIMLKMPSGLGVRISASYDGIGDRNLEVWTTKAWISVPLN